MELIETFTREKILYDPATHVYTDLEGRKMLSGSAYAEKLSPEFDAEKIAGFVAKKYKATKADILGMWDMNGAVSRTFGTALHLAMEQHFRFRGLGTVKNYNRTKIRYLSEAVDSFPLRDADAVPEAFVSDSAALRCGRLDLILLHEPTVVSIVDYKTDSNVEKNIDRHTLQLNFYRAILEARGFAVRGMTLWSYDGAWTPHNIHKKEV